MRSLPPPPSPGWSRRRVHIIMFLRTSMFLDRLRVGCGGGNRFLTLILARHAANITVRSNTERFKELRHHRRSFAQSRFLGFHVFCFGLSLVPAAFGRPPEAPGMRSESFGGAPRGLPDPPRDFGHHCWTSSQLELCRGQGRLPALLW